MSLVDEHGHPLNEPATPVKAKAPQAPIRVTIAIPARDQVATNFMYDLTGMVAATARNRRDIELRLVVIKGTLIADQRHKLVQHARTADSTHILWLDADHRFPKDTLVRLLAHDVDIAAASYAERRIPPRPVTFLHDEGDGGVDERLYIEPDATGLIEVASMGMGVMLTRIEVFAYTPAPWFQIGWHTEKQSYIGEDIYFARKAREHGFKVFVDQDLSREVMHIGEIEFSNDHALAVRDELRKAEQS
jgi:hypothetical protein